MHFFPHLVKHDAPYYCSIYIESLLIYYQHGMYKLFAFHAALSLPAPGWAGETNQLHAPGPRLIPISLPYERCQRRVPHLDMHPVPITLRIASARCHPFPRRDGTNVMCQRLDAIVLVCLPCESARRDVTRDGDLLCDADALLCKRLVDGGVVWAAATCPAGGACVSLTKKICTAPPFYYYSIISELNFVFRLFRSV